MENTNRNNEINDHCEKEISSGARQDDEIVEPSTNDKHCCFEGDRDEHDDQDPPILSSSDSSLSLSSSKSSSTATEELQINESSSGRIYECIDLDDVVSLDSDDEDLELGKSKKKAKKKKDWIENKDSRSTAEDGTNITEDSSASISSNPSLSNSSTSAPTSRWTQCLLFLHRPIRKVIVETSVFSAKHPKSCVLGIVTLALALVSIGFFTNFTIEKQEDKLWTPQGSKPDLHFRWIEKTFPAGSDPREYYLATLLHANGENVASIEGIQRQFQVMERIRSVPGYNDFCKQHGQPVCGVNDEGLELACKWYNIPNDPENRDCEVLGVTSFWLQNYTLFEILAKSDGDVLRTLSIATIPGKYSEFDISNIVGYPEYDVNKTLTSGKAFLTYYIIPRNETNDVDYAKAEALERLVTAELKLLQEEWDQNNTNPYRIEMFATRSFEDEFVRGVNEDMVLLPVVALLMMAFTSLVFYKHRDPLNSRSLLGIGATGTVVVSIMTGYGIMFICGVPFTSLSQVCVFIVFGIALDDTFIIFGSYICTDPAKDPVERIRETMEEVGISIFMTTVTTVFAFGLGCITTIPAISWLCKYGVTTIAIDFFWQITLFVALLVLDERRIAARRADCLFCCKVAEPEPDNEQNEGSISDFSSNQNSKSDDDFEKHEHISVRLMRKFSNVLFIPWVKALALLCFTSLFGVCIWGASQLEVDFDFRSTLPSDSYLIRFQTSLTCYTQRQGPSPYIYFRDVNQSDSEVWDYMEQYVDDVVNSSAISAQPFHFWLRDFQNFTGSNATLTKLPFNESLAIFLDNPAYVEYKKDMVLDENGYVIASRTMVHMDNVDPTRFEDGRTAIRQITNASANNPLYLKQGGDDWPCFVFDKLFFLWEFLIVSPSMLKQSTFIGIASVSAMSLFFMPHWSGVLFVAPVTGILYVDLLGVLYFAGIDINAISYVALVMAIGLLVDYSMHVVLKFQEIRKSSRNQGAKEVLESMGASVLLGGVSTLMGILPLVFSSNDLTVTFVVSLVSVVLLGLSHGLIFLPVVLSLLGHCPGEAHPLEFLCSLSSSTRKMNDSNGKKIQSLQTSG